MRIIVRFASIDANLARWFDAGSQFRFILVFVTVLALSLPVGSARPNLKTWPACCISPVEHPPASPIKRSFDAAAPIFLLVHASSVEGPSSYTQSALSSNWRELPWVGRVPSWGANSVCWVRRSARVVHLFLRVRCPCLYFFPWYYKAVWWVYDHQLLSRM